MDMDNDESPDNLVKRNPWVVKNDVTGKTLAEFFSVTSANMYISGYRDGYAAGIKDRQVDKNEGTIDESCSNPPHES